MLGALNILDELERVIKSVFPDRGIIYTELNKATSSLAALAQIHDALVRHQPTFQAILQDSDALFSQHKGRLRAIDDLEEYLTGTSLGPYTKPDSSFVYPVERKRTLEHVEQMRRAESKLDVFWDQVGKSKLKPRTGRTLLQWLGHRVAIREIHRTPPWQPAPEKPAKPAPSQAPIQPSIDFSSQWSNGSVYLGTIELRTEPRKKQKTRGKGSSKNEPAEPTEIPQDTKLTLPTFVLPSKLYKTMRAFFPISDQDRVSRKVIWKDFLHAMYDLDFRIQKRHGSEWYFEPTWRREAPITIHEPHPSHEMRFDKIRFEANRMARKYSWSSETFAQASWRTYPMKFTIVNIHDTYVRRRNYKSEYELPVDIETPRKC
ncbi:MAG: hypothetical protein Q9213_007178 [Squamulea squamosa]